MASVHGLVCEDALTVILVVNVAAVLMLQWLHGHLWRTCLNDHGGRLCRQARRTHVARRSMFKAVALVSPSKGHRSLARSNDSGSVDTLTSGP